MFEEELTDVRWEEVSEEETTWKILEVDGRIVFGGGTVYLLQIWNWKAAVRKREGRRKVTRKKHIK